VKTLVRKIKNISKAAIPIKISEATTVYIQPGTSLEDIEVYNLSEIRSMVSVEEDLTEVAPVTGRSYLKS